MGAQAGAGESTCQSCGRLDPTVCVRGRAFPMAELCDDCWIDIANDLAEYEGATAGLTPKSGSDDVEWIEPAKCPECHGEIMAFPTNYDRSVHLASREFPAKEIPSRYRWRLMRIPGQFPPVAVRVAAAHPLPGELVRPAHVAVCLSPDAVAAVEDARESDLRRAQPREPG
ncbi:DUF6083 domain-containing protein [Streptomyces niveus]|uniref:DUF6083 domain-containing protein n=1 Tax=Streptomyces niveus TaxID=193462 RepID=UPI0033FDD6BD